MKGLLYADIYSTILPLLNPHTQSNLTSFNKKFHYLFKSYQKRNQDFVKESSYFGLLIPSLFFINTKNEVTWALWYAAKGGQLKLCYILIDLGANHFNWALRFAAEGGHLKLCTILIRSGANHFDWALADAARGGHLNLCSFFIRQHGAVSFNDALVKASYGGYIDICKYMISCGATHINWALNFTNDEETKKFLRNAL